MTSKEHILAIFPTATVFRAGHNFFYIEVIADHKYLFVGSIAYTEQEAYDLAWRDILNKTLEKLEQ